MSTDFRPWQLGARNPEKYKSIINFSAVYQESEGYGFGSELAEATEFGTICHQRDAAEYRGKRIRLTAELKTENCEVGASMWARADAPNPNDLAFDKMGDRILEGTNNWQESSLFCKLQRTQPN